MRPQPSRQQTGAYRKVLVRRELSGRGLHRSRLVHRESDDERIRRLCVCSRRLSRTSSAVQRRALPGRDRIGDDRPDERGNPEDDHEPVPEPSPAVPSARRHVQKPAHEHEPRSGIRRGPPPEAALPALPRGEGEGRARPHHVRGLVEHRARLPVGVRPDLHRRRLDHSRTAGVLRAGAPIMAARSCARSPTWGTAPSGTSKTGSLRSRRLRSASTPTARFRRRWTRSDIRRVVRAFGDAAVRCRDGGLDGVELLAYGHLIHQFWTPLVNRRTDEYGGSLENRARFGLEVLEEVRRRVGDDFLVGFRMMGDELKEGGLDQEDCLTLARVLRRHRDVRLPERRRGPGRPTNAGLSLSIPSMAGLARSLRAHRGPDETQETGLAVFHATRIMRTSQPRSTACAKVSSTWWR